MSNYNAWSKVIGGLEEKPTDTKEVDSIFEDAARYRWLFSGRTQEELDACERQGTQPVDVPQDHVMSELMSFYVTKKQADQLIDEGRKSENNG